MKKCIFVFCLVFTSNTLASDVAIEDRIDNFFQLLRVDSRKAISGIGCFSSKLSEKELSLATDVFDSYTYTNTPAELITTIAYDDKIKELIYIKEIDGPPHANIYRFLGAKNKCSSSKYNILNFVFNSNFISLIESGILQPIEENNETIQIGLIKGDIHTYFNDHPNNYFTKHNFLSKFEKETKDKYTQNHTKIMEEMNDLDIDIYQIKKLGTSIYYAFVVAENEKHTEFKYFIYYYKNKNMLLINLSHNDNFIFSWSKK